MAHFFKKGNFTYDDIASMEHLKFGKNCASRNLSAREIFSLMGSTVKNRDSVNKQVQENVFHLLIPG